MSLLTESRTVLQQEFTPDGYNIGMNLGTAAGAGIPGHVHFHIVPRWDGDTNFMPVTGDVKVLPETLVQTHDRLVAAWET
jgi:ATP adenylyltransferase